MVPEVYRMSAVVSRVTSVGLSMSEPSPPIAGLIKDSQGMVLGASAVSCARALRSDGIGSRSAIFCSSGIASVMLTETMVSSGVRPRSFSSVGAALSQQMATRAPWSLKGCSSSWAV